MKTEDLHIRNNFIVKHGFLPPKNNFRKYSDLDSPAVVAC